MMMDKADIYLVSYASIRPEVFTVVSQETPNPNHPGEIKLPDVCNAFGTRCIFLQNMFREITETFQTASPLPIPELMTAEEGEALRGNEYSQSIHLVCIFRRLPADDLNAIFHPL